ncbi:hypothetical protein [Dyadobacter tibetensis]|uniref:hypothetical protein n=1 Tax=Dyadobacter tibetensis TaxID=1211851 RepID=UPI0004703512|nr:hypothetical protein [Dyadobacter tibetensis]
MRFILFLGIIFLIGCIYKGRVIQPTSRLTYELHKTIATDLHLKSSANAGSIEPVKPPTLNMEEWLLEELEEKKERLAIKLSLLTNRIHFRNTARYFCNYLKDRILQFSHFEQIIRGQNRYLFLKVFRI